MTIQKNNIVRLTPLNPNVSLGKDDYLQRPMFPSDDKLKNIVTSDEFRRLLLTDASTDGGQDFLATYYHAEITASSGSAVVVSLRRIGARGARDVTRAPYWGPRGARCNWLLNPLR